MEFEEARPFLEQNHWGVVTTFQPDGAAHSSIIVCGAYQNQAAFVIVRGWSVKLRNLRRDPRCSVLAVSKDWRASVAVEGEARLYDYDNTDSEEVRVMFREVFRACGDKDHSDWEEYDQAMKTQRAVIALVRPGRVYGRLP
jgi:PPOX class probable F420-dependent enzyme